MPRTTSVHPSTSSPTRFAAFPPTMEGSMTHGPSRAASYDAVPRGPGRSGRERGGLAGKPAQHRHVDRTELQAGSVALRGDPEEAAGDGPDRNPDRRPPTVRLQQDHVLDRSLGG